MDGKRRKGSTTESSAPTLKVLDLIDTFRESLVETILHREEQETYNATMTRLQLDELAHIRKSIMSEQQEANLRRGVAAETARTGVGERIERMQKRIAAKLRRDADTAASRQTMTATAALQASQAARLKASLFSRCRATLPLHS